MIKKKKDLPFADYEISAWIMRLGSFPVECIKTGDAGESYVKEQFHVVKLENGKFASIHESGCSCYEASNAEIDLHPNQKSAMTAYRKWEITQIEYGKSIL